MRLLDCCLMDNGIPSTESIFQYNVNKSVALCIESSNIDEYIVTDPVFYCI